MNPCLAGLSARKQVAGGYRNCLGRTPSFRTAYHAPTVFYSRNIRELVTVFAVSLFTIPVNEASAVNLGIYRFQMFRINASSNAALMVDV